MIDGKHLNTLSQVSPRHHGNCRTTRSPVLVFKWLSEHAPVFVVVVDVVVALS